VNTASLSAWSRLSGKFGQIGSRQKGLAIYPTNLVNFENLFTRQNTSGSVTMKTGKNMNNAVTSTAQSDNQAVHQLYNTTDRS